MHLSEVTGGEIGKAEIEDGNRKQEEKRGNAEIAEERKSRGESEL